MTTKNLPAQAEEKKGIATRLDEMAVEFKKALPAHISVERFIRTVRTAVQLSPDVARAATATEAGMRSLLGACTKAATDGVILDGREAALVTFNVKVSKRNEPDRWEAHVQYIPMVAGLMKMARNSGVISSISANVVYEKDKFAYVLGDDERIEHEPKIGDRGRPILVYAIVRLKDGSVQREVMDRDAIMRIAAQSKNPKQYDPADGKNYGEWWRKCVIRRIVKYLPRSSDREGFFNAAERIDETFEFEPDESVPVETAPRGGKRRGAAAAALKDVTPQPAAQPKPTDPPHDEDGVIIDQDGNPEDDGGDEPVRHDGADF